MALNAGDIIFQLTADDSQLRKTMQHVKANMAAASRAIGTGMTAAGAAITGFAAMSVSEFTKSADAIGKMSDRTGMSADMLSRLDFAAQQGGGSITDLEKSTRNFARVLTDARDGSSMAADTLAKMGRTVQDYAGLNPDQIFMLTAKSIAAIQDPTTRAATAMEAWGTRAGTSLLPALKGGVEGLQQIMATTPRVFTGEDTQRAADYNDAMNELKLSGQALSDEVAKALVPALTEFAKSLTPVVQGITNWVKENPELTASIVKITTGVGALMLAVGPWIVALPGLIAGGGLLKAAFLAVGGAIAGVAAVVGAPVALIIAAIAGIVAAAVALWKYWDEVKAALTKVWEGIKSAFFAIWGPIIDTIKWLASVGLGILDRVGGWFGQSGNGALNQDALDRYNNRGRGIDARGAGLPAPAAGGMGGVHIGTMNVLSNDPSRASRDIAAQLQRELSGLGLAF